MPARKLSEGRTAPMNLGSKLIAALEPKPRAYEVKDAILPELSIRVSRREKTFFARIYSPTGKHKRVALGLFPEMAVEDAREKARALAWTLLRGTGWTK